MSQRCCIHHDWILPLGYIPWIDFSTIWPIDTTRANEWLYAWIIFGVSLYIFHWQPKQKNKTVTMLHTSRWSCTYICGYTLTAPFKNWIQTRTSETPKCTSKPNFRLFFHHERNTEKLKFVKDPSHIRLFSQNIQKIFWFYIPHHRKFMR